ncbi:MAG: glycosyltransferase [Patescibacteria group bacterium]
MSEDRKKLNIAMVCDPVGSNKSGVVVSTMRFGKLLRERGHHIVFIGARSQEHKDHSHHDGIKAYRYRSFPVPKSGGWNLAFPSVGELKNVFEEEKIDVVHIILPMSGAIMAIRAAKSLNIKIVAHSHSQPENLFMDMPKIIRPALGHMWNKFLIWVYGKAESLIYPSEMARALLDKLSDKNQPSVVISNGINLREFKTTNVGDFHERFNIPNDIIKLLFVGRLFPEKSIDTLIKAVPHIIKEHENTHIMIVGGGYLKSKLEKLTLSLGMGKHITFLGLISDEDKILAYNASDIFVMPSLAELEGMAVLEAMACGKPIVVANSKESASKYFVNDNGFLFDPYNHLDLADKVLTLLHDRELRERMGQKSFEISKNYDIDKSVLKLEQLYYSLL